MTSWNITHNFEGMILFRLLKSGRERLEYAMTSPTCLWCRKHTASGEQYSGTESLRFWAENGLEVRLKGSKKRLPACLYCFLFSYLSRCLSVRMEPLGSLWTNFSGNLFGVRGDDLKYRENLYLVRGGLKEHAVYMKIHGCPWVVWWVYHCWRRASSIRE